VRAIKLVYSDSKVGRLHKERGLLNQDVIKYSETEDLVLGVLADGVSAAKFGGQGALIATETVADFLLKNSKSLFSINEEHLKNIILNEVQSALSRQAVEGNVEDYASTLVFASFQKSTNKLMLFSLGDSMIYLFSSQGCTPFENNTRKELRFTVSEDALKSTEFKIVPTEDIKGVMLCSDGAWRTMYSDGMMLPSLLKAGETFELEAFKEHFEKQDCLDDMSVIMLA
jgi:serine/threonine protein phosphatase PrpC